jgi:hypothetical protein
MLKEIQTRSQSSQAVIASATAWFSHIRLSAPKLSRSTDEDPILEWPGAQQTKPPLSEFGVVE